MSKRLVIWDFDGTLADTLRIALHVFNDLAEDRGFLPIDDPDSVRDMSMSEFLAAHKVRMHQIPAAFAELLRRIHQRRRTIRMNDGIAAAVSKLHNSGIEQAVVSSNNAATISGCLKQAKIEQCFRSIHGTSRLFGKSKTLQRVAAKYGRTPQQVLYVGDEIRDIEAARAAGTACAAATWGLNSEAALRSAQPNYIVHSPSDVADLLKATATPQQT